MLKLSVESKDAIAFVSSFPRKTQSSPNSHQYNPIIELQEQTHNPIPTFSFQLVRDGCCVGRDSCCVQLVAGIVAVCNWLLCSSN
jgi:hypothetical protein